MDYKILIADDEKDLARAIRMILQYSGYIVDETHNGKEALEKAKINAYDVILLDIMMPIMDGIETLKHLRKLNINTPVILLTAKSQVDDKVEGLDSGANDYLTKPFNKEELLARIRALLRYKEEKNHKYQMGNIIFDKQKAEISTSKATLHLSNKECDLVEFLFKNPKKKISNIEIQQRVWSDEKVENAIVPIYISYIQDKFSALDANVKIKSKNNTYMLENLL